MAKSKPKKSKPKQTAAQKNLSSWTKTVNKYSGGWTNSKDYKALMKSKEKKDMDASVVSFSSNKVTLSPAAKYVGWHLKVKVFL